jgi:hypothetical protein
MRKGLLSFMLFVLMVTVFSYSNVLAGKKLTERQALDILAARILKDKLYDSWAPNLSCLLFFTEEKANDHFDFAIREKHGGKCPGDPNTAPIVDRFRVNRSTKIIQWYDPTEGELVPYEAVLKARLKK